jgi:hypothetical protein
LGEGLFDAGAEGVAEVGVGVEFVDAGVEGALGARGGAGAGLASARRTPDPVAADQLAGMRTVSMT